VGVFNSKEKTNFLFVFFFYCPISGLLPDPIFFYGRGTVGVRVILFFILPLSIYSIIYIIERVWGGVEIRYGDASRLTFFGPFITL